MLRIVTRATGLLYVVSCFFACSLSGGDESTTLGQGQVELELEPIPNGWNTTVIDVDAPACDGETQVQLPGLFVRYRALDEAITDSIRKFKPVVRWVTALDESEYTQDYFIPAAPPPSDPTRTEIGEQYANFRSVELRYDYMALDPSADGSNDDEPKFILQDGKNVEVFNWQYFRTAYAAYKRPMQSVRERLVRVEIAHPPEVIVERVESSFIKGRIERFRQSGYYQPDTEGADPVDRALGRARFYDNWYWFETNGIDVDASDVTDIVDGEIICATQGRSRPYITQFELTENSHPLIHLDVPAPCTSRQYEEVGLMLTSTDANYRFEMAGLNQQGSILEGTRVVSHVPKPYENYVVTETTSRLGDNIDKLQLIFEDSATTMSDFLSSVHFPSRREDRSYLRMVPPRLHYNVLVVLPSNSFDRCVQPY